MRKSGQRGFTLVELLVVVGIIATMASIAIPAVGRFVAPAHAAADDNEFGRVQAAMDMYISQNSLPNPPPFVAENTSPTSNFSAPTTPELYPLYLRDATTRCEYTWDDTGQISQVNCP